MKIEIIATVSMVALSLFYLYLAVCGEPYFSIAVVTCTFIALFLYRLNNAARYVGVIVATGNLLLNVATLNLLYGTGSESNEAFQLLVNNFNDVRFSIEISLSILLSLINIVVLLLPAAAKKYRS